MNIFTIFILQNFSKIFSKTHQIAPFKKNFGGACPEPPSRSHALHGASRHPNNPTFPKIF